MLFKTRCLTILFLINILNFELSGRDFQILTRAGNKEFYLVFGKNDLR